MPQSSPRGAGRVSGDGPTGVSVRFASREVPRSGPGPGAAGASAHRGAPPAPTPRGSGGGPRPAPTRLPPPTRVRPLGPAAPARGPRRAPGGQEGGQATRPCDYTGHGPIPRRFATAPADRGTVDDVSLVSSDFRPTDPAAPWGFRAPASALPSLARGFVGNDRVGAECRRERPAGVPGRGGPLGPLGGPCARGPGRPGGSVRARGGGREGRGQPRRGDHVGPVRRAPPPGLGQPPPGDGRGPRAHPRTPPLPSTPGTRRLPPLPDAGVSRRPSSGAGAASPPPPSTGSTPSSRSAPRPSGAPT